MRGESKNNNNKEISAEKSEYSGPLFVIRWKWLLGTVAFFAILGGVLYGIYRFQTRDQGDFLIQSITSNLAEDNFRKTLEPLIRYQKEHPDNIKVQRVLAEIYDEKGVTQNDWENAVQYYRSFVSLDKTLDEKEKLNIYKRILDNQRKILPYAHTVPAIPAAMLDTIKEILAMSPNEPEAWKNLVSVRVGLLSGGSYELKNKMTDEPTFFDELLKKALTLNPADNELTTAYTRLLRTKDESEGDKKILKCLSPEFQGTTLEERCKQADEIMELFVENKDIHGNPAPEKTDITGSEEEIEKAKKAEQAKKLLIHYEYRAANNMLDPNGEEMDSDLQKIMELDPNNPVALSYVGSFLEQQAYRVRMEKATSDYELAKNLALEKYNQMIKTNPYFSFGYIQLANLYRVDDDMKNRILTLENGNKALRASDLGILIALIVAYLENNDPENALKNIASMNQWVARNRLGKNLAPIENYIAMLEARLLAIQGKPAEAIQKFRRIFEPNIPDGDDQLIFDSLMVYAQQLEDVVLWEDSAGVYRKTIDYFEMKKKDVEPLNIAKMRAMYMNLMGAYLRIGMLKNADEVLERYIAYLEKVLTLQNNNQMVRFWLASALDAQNVSRPDEEKNWDAIQKQLDILKIPSNKRNVFPSWQVDLLQAKILLEKILAKTTDASLSDAEEAILIPLRAVENTYSFDLGFLREAESFYSALRSTEDEKRVLDIISKHPNGRPLWYAIKVLRLSETGNTREVRTLIDEAIKEFEGKPEKEAFLTMSNSLSSNENNSQTTLELNKQRLAQLHKEADEKKSIALYFQVGLLELDMGNLDEVKKIEETLQKMEDEKTGTLNKYLRAERLLQEAKTMSENDPNIIAAREIQRGLIISRQNWDRSDLLLANIEDKLGNESKVLAAEMNAIKKGNNDPMIYRDIIGLALKLKEERIANEYFAKAVQLFPNIMERNYSRFDPPYQAISVNFFRAIRRENIEEAEKIASEWLKTAEANLPPENKEMQLAIFNSVIGQGFFSIDKLEISKKYFEEASKRGGETVLPLAKYYAASEKMTEALKIIRGEMEKAASKSEDATLFLPAILGLLRDYKHDDKDVEWFENWVLNYDISKEENSAKVFELIRFLMVRDKEEQTLPFYRRMCELEPKRADLKNDLAYLIANQTATDDSAKQSNLSEALRLIDEAIEMNPNDAMIIDTKGLILLLQDKPQAAVPLFEKAYNLSDGGLIFQLHWAAALLRSGNTKDAEKQFTAVRDIFEPQLEAISKANQKYFEELAKAFPKDEK